MKRVYLSYTAIILLLALILMLSGCGAISDEAQIRSVISGFCNAVNNQNWDNARSYCVYGSETYNRITNWEYLTAQFGSENLTMDYSFNISNIIITGDYATADGFSSVIITTNGESEEESGDQTMNLKKVDNSWKIYYIYYMI